MTDIDSFKNASEIEESQQLGYDFDDIFFRWMEYINPNRLGVRACRFAVCNTRKLVQDGF